MGNSAETPATDINQTFEDITSINSQSWVIDEEYINVLRKDFKVLESMKLIDNPDMLYTLYMKSPFCSSRKCVLHLLVSLYRQKYPLLFTTYPSIDSYVTFCLSIVLYHGEERMKSICNSSYASRLGNSSSFNMMSRKLKIERTPSEVTVKKGKPTPVHPLFDLGFYRENLTVLSIGAMTKHCVPSEFALMFCLATKEMVDRTIQPDKTIQYTGIRGKFTRPVIAILRSRMKQELVFSNFENLDSIELLLSKMSSCNTVIDAFSLAIKDDMKCENIVTKNTSKIDEWTTFDTGVNMAIIDNFDCVGTSCKSLNIRSYTNIVYSLSSSIVRLSDKTIKEMDAEINLQAAKLEKNMDDYQKLMEEAEAGSFKESTTEEAELQV